MDELKGLATDKWYRALTYLSVALIVGVAALAGDPALRKALLLLGFGGVLVGLGQWIDHPYREGIGMGYKISGYGHKASVAGVLMTLCGVVLCGRAAWLLW